MPKLYFCAMLQWFEQWFNSPYYHLLYRHRDQGEAGAFIKNLVAFLKPEDDAHFLDLACGSGRHSLFLNKLGYKVSGADISTNNIEMAKNYEREGLDFMVHDMRNPLPGGPYDFILNLFTSFGYFEEDADQLKTLHSVKDGLTQKGMFVLDFLNAHKVIRELVPEEEQVHEGVQFKIKRYVQNGWLYKEIDITDGHERSHFREEVRVLTDKDFHGLFEQAGLKISNIFGDYQLHPYQPQTSDRLILCASK